MDANEELLDSPAEITGLCKALTTDKLAWDVLI